MLRLYSAPRTRSIRVAWLLEELNLEYELIQGEFERTSSSFFIQKTPTGKFPTLEDDDMVMFESGAIAEYVLEKYGDGHLAPAVGDPQRGEFLQWMYFADATAFTPVGVVAWLTLYRDDTEQHPDLVRDAYVRAKTGFDQLQTHLSDKDYLLGEKFSAADIMVAFTLMSAQALQILSSDSPLMDYLERLQARPAFAQAAQKTGNL